MQTRIREIRKRRGLTLQQLADKVGTTPQTVQRLETANMTVSVEWLNRFADAFGVRPADLIADGSGRSVPLLGGVGRDGILRVRAENGEPETIELDVPADDPIAVRLDSDIGCHVAGSYLVGTRLQGPNLVNAHGQDCIVKLHAGTILLRRLIYRDGEITLVPLDPSADIRFNAEVLWAARLVLQLRYI